MCAHRFTLLVILTCLPECLGPLADIPDGIAVEAGAFTIVTRDRAGELLCIRTKTNVDGGVDNAWRTQGGIRIASRLESSGRGKQ